MVINGFDFCSTSKSVQVCSGLCLLTRIQLVKCLRSSCHALTVDSLYVSIFSLVRVWCGWLFYVVGLGFLFLCVCPGMVLNQRQLSIVVPDWEPYLGSLFSHFELWVIIFRFSVCTIHCFGFHLFSCSFVRSWLLFLRRRRDSLHFQSTSACIVLLCVDQYPPTTCCHIIIYYSVIYSVVTIFFFYMMRRHYLYSEPTLQDILLHCDL